VIDLLNGIVVHAKKGARAQYQAVESSLTNSRYPLDIVKAFMALHPFKTLYVADLNAIQGIVNVGQSHQQILEEIHQSFPDITIWIDAGINHRDNVITYKNTYTKIVLGSESFSELSQYQTLSHALDNAHLLSLDFLPGGYAGPRDLLHNIQYWPKDIIVMTLSQVGSNAGIDYRTIRTITSNASKHHIYAAGGIRHINDLLSLKQLNVYGALVASALHNQQLSSRDLTSLCP
jgi:phosphoribosylformimino-5-aminoimidazole carboxamide ribotide isomerase